MGRSSPDSSLPPRRWRAAPSSSAKNGLPPDASQSFISTGRANVASRRSRNSWCVAPRLSPRTRTARRRLSSTARLTQSGTSSRTASTVATRSWLSRATAYRIADSEAASSHWTSSTARQRERSTESNRSAPRNAAATARGSAPSSESPSSNAASRASRWIGGSPGKTSPTTSPSMSVSARNENPASACEGRADKTWNPRAAARSTAAIQSAVLPIPASPVITAIDGSCSGASRRPRSAATSSSLPTTFETPASQGASKPRFYDLRAPAKRGFSRCSDHFHLRCRASSGSTSAHHHPVEPVGVADHAGELQLGERRGDSTGREARATDDLVGADRRVGDRRLHRGEARVERRGAAAAPGRARARRAHRRGTSPGPRRGASR